MLALFGETSGGPALKRMKRKMEEDTTGKKILKLVLLLSIKIFLKFYINF